MWDFGPAMTFVFRLAVGAVIALLGLAFLAGKYL
jgi:hypothetical protein